MPPEQIDRAVGALLALALDLAVADQAIEPRAGLASIKGEDQPRDRGAGYPMWQLARHDYVCWRNMGRLTHL